MDFEASLLWDGDPPREPALPTDTFPPCVRVSVEERREGGGREVCGRILALEEDNLRLAFDGVLRRLAVFAGVTGAVFQSRCVRGLSPGVPEPATVRGVAESLISAGFPVSFGPVWLPVEDGSLVLGSHGMHEELEGYLVNGGGWSPRP